MVHRYLPIQKSKKEVNSFYTANAVEHSGVRFRLHSLIDHTLRKTEIHTEEANSKRDFRIPLAFRNQVIKTFLRASICQSLLGARDTNTQTYKEKKEGKEQNQKYRRERQIMNEQKTNTRRYKVWSSCGGSHISKEKP